MFQVSVLTPYFKGYGINFMVVVIDLMLLFQTGIKINRKDMLDARGFNRSRISSHAIEAYLIQVKGHHLSNFIELEPCD